MKKELLIILILAVLLTGLSWFAVQKRSVVGDECEGKTDGTHCTLRGDPLQSGYCYQDQCLPLREPGGASCHEEKLPEYDYSTRFDFLEFCIPEAEWLLRDIENIEGVVEFSCQSGPKGRIGCDENEYLCTLASRTPRQALCGLSRLKYIKKIQGSYAE